MNLIEALEQIVDLHNKYPKDPVACANSAADIAKQALAAAHGLEAANEALSAGVLALNPEAVMRREAELLDEIGNLKEALAAAKAVEPVALSKEVRDFLQEAINDATQCEDADIDHAFARELSVLLGPIYTSPQPAWRSMDSAPKDDRNNVVFWLPKSERFVTGHECWWLTRSEFWSTDEQPTAWMPLEAPKE